MNRLDLDLEAFVVDHALSDATCDTLIQIAETMGFSDLRMNESGEEQKDGGLGTNESTLIHSTDLAAALLTRIKIVLPNVLQCDKLNPLIRFERFTGSQSVQPHVDGFLAVKDDDNGIYVSQYTVMFYLSDTAPFAPTRFINMMDMDYLDVHPKKGRLLLFDQRLCHAAMPLGKQASNIFKYTLRTDALYKVADPIVESHREGLPPLSVILEPVTPRIKR